MSRSLAVIAGYAVAVVAMLAIALLLFDITGQGDRMRLGIFVLAGVMIIVLLVDARRRALRDAELNRRQLEREVIGRERAEAALRDSAEQLPHVFDMFYQVDHSLERAQGGLGIGLTLANRVVRMHGGSIRVHSDGIGRGSGVVVRLPVHLEPAIAPADACANGRLTAT